MTGCVENGPWSLSRLKAKQVKAKFFIILVSGYEWSKASLLGLVPGSALLVLKLALSYEAQAWDASLEMSLHRIQPHSTSP